MQSDFTQFCAEIASLKSTIAELTSRPYKPVEGDLVDTYLAQCINESPNAPQYTKLFKRESEGLYRFGTKKALIKVDQGIPVVRVDRHYLALGDFLQHYTPIESVKA